MTIFLILSSIWAILSLLLLALSWNFIRIGNVKWHRNLMLISAAGGILFVILYLSNQAWFTPLELPPAYLKWLYVHSIIGVIALVGACLLILARFYAAKTHHLNQQHRLYGRIFISLWVFTHLGGLYNASLLLSN